MHAQAVYGAQHDTHALRAALQLEDDVTQVSLGAFSEQIRDGFPAFEALQDVAAERG